MSILLAGFALNTVGSLVNGLMPCALLGGRLLDDDELGEAWQQELARLLHFLVADGRQRLDDGLHVLLRQRELVGDFLDQLDFDIIGSGPSAKEQPRPLRRPWLRPASHDAMADSGRIVCSYKPMILLVSHSGEGRNPVTTAGISFVCLVPYSRRPRPLPRPSIIAGWRECNEVRHLLALNPSPRSGTRSSMLRFRRIGFQINDKATKYKFRVQPADISAPQPQPAANRHKVVIDRKCMILRTRRRDLDDPAFGRSAPKSSNT